MAIFGNKGLSSIQGNVGSRMTKAADIYVRSNTGSSGTVTDPAVYTNAISMLAPNANNPAVKLKMAEYANSAKALAAKNTDQNMTLATFKQNLDDSIFFKSTSNRDPYTLARNTADTLDTALAVLDQNISTLNEQGKTTDTLLTYRQTLATAAAQQRALVNGIVNGTVNPQQDGYGYYVKTNPATGQLLGVALLPSDVSGLTDTTSKMARISAQANVNGATKIPVYMSASTDSTGAKEATLGQNTWSGTGSGALTQSSGSDFADDNFDLATPNAQAKFPTQQGTALQPGQVGKVISSVDANGNSQYTYYYKGKDNSLNAITDPAVINALGKDPVLGNAANNPIFLSPDDVKAMGTTTPMGLPQLQGLDASAQQPAQTTVASGAPAPAPAPGANPLESFFGKIAPKGNPIQDGLSAIGNGISSFFNRTNRTPGAPATPPESVGGQPSAPDIIGKGASFFNSAPSTLPPTP